MDDKKIDKELKYHNVIGNETLVFELIKDLQKNQRRAEIKSYIFGGLLALILLIGAYILTNFKVIHTTTTETIETGGDYNEYTNNANDNRSIHNYDKESRVE